MCSFDDSAFRTAYRIKSNKLFCKRWLCAQLLAFEAVKAMITCNTLLTYPDLNELVDIKTDASDYQLGVVIKQHGCPSLFSPAS
jgi:hypothetical protein